MNTGEWLTTENGASSLRKTLWLLIVPPLLLLAGSKYVSAEFSPAGPATVTTGVVNPSLSTFDDLMTSFMAKRHVPGGALAVVKAGRLVYARGYGWADVERRIPVYLNSLFRIASLSKMITAAAIMTLVEHGRLNLDAPAFPLLHLEAHLEPGTDIDPRLWRVTVRQLL